MGLFLNEKSQMEKDKYFMISLISEIKIKGMNKPNQTRTHRYREEMVT